MSMMFLTWQPKTHRNTMMSGKEAMLTNISVNLNCLYFKLHLPETLQFYSAKLHINTTRAFFINIQNITKVNRKL
jgi:hypothetical protein